MADSIETYTLLAKQATGRALESLIEKVIDAPSLFSFTELLQTPSIQALKDTEYAGSLVLLQIFSYGTLRDLRDCKTSLPTISAGALHKLKQLSLVSLANASHHLDYDALKAALEVPQTRELENLIISTTYAGLISAKLNTRLNQVYIESTIGRDLDPATSIDAMLTALDVWQGTCSTVLGQISSNIEAIKSEGRRRRQAESEHAMAIAVAKSQAKTVNAPNKRRDGQYDDVMSDLNEDEESGMLTPRPNAFMDIARQNGRKRKTPMPRR